MDDRSQRLAYLPVDDLMELPQAIDLINTAMFARWGRYLSDAELAIVRGSWGGQTYSAIAESSGYSLSYLSTDLGPVLWRNLSAALGERVSKTNFQGALERYQGRSAPSPITNPQPERAIAPTLASPPVAPPTQTYDLGDIVDVRHFFGRSTELATLTHWVLHDQCRLIAILGMGGVGKTSLAAKLTRDVATSDHFDYVIWRSLYNAPPLETLLADLILFLSGQTDTRTDITRLLYWLQARRCLVILDNLETILQPGDRAGHYRDGYETYGELFQAVGRAIHQSCLIVTSREKPVEMAAIEGAELAGRSLTLSGSAEVGEALLQAKGLVGSGQQRQVLCDRYSGNPLALKIVATSIQDLFDGAIEPFISQDTFLFNGIRRLLEQQFERLSYLEQSVMYWLAINRDWTGISDLENDIVPRVSRASLLESLESLCWRGLIEKRLGTYTQQAVVMEYVSDRLTERLILELTTVKPLLFLHYALVKTTVRDYIRESQTRLILNVVASALKTSFGSIASLRQHMLRMLASLRQSEARVPGYGAGNLINLCGHLTLELTGTNFSGLTIRHALFQPDVLHHADLTNAHLEKSRFVQSFGCIFAIAIGPVLAGADGYGQWLAAGGNGELYLWQLRGSEQFFTLEGHSYWVTSVAFSSDGSLLVSGGCDQTVRLWDVATQRSIGILTGHTNSVWSVAISPDAQTIASGSEDATVRLWQRSTGASQVLSGHAAWVTAVAFSPAGDLLASADVSGAVYLWNVHTGTICHRLAAHAAGEVAITFSPDGRYLASGGHDHRLCVWDVQTQQIQQTIDSGAPISAVAFSPDGHTLAIGGHNKEITLWQWATPRVVKRIRGHQAWVSSVAFSPDGRAIATSSFDRTLRLWDVATGQQLKTVTGYVNGVQALLFVPKPLFSADGNTATSIDTLAQYPQRLISGGADATLRIWDLETRRVVETLRGHTQPICSIALSPDQRYLATGSDDQTVRLWDVATRRTTHVLLGHTSWVRSVAFGPRSSRSPQGILASAANDNTVRLWDVATGQLIQVLTEHTNWVTSIAFSPDGALLASGGDDQTLQLWDTATWTLLSVLKGHTHWIWDLAFSPDGTTLASSSEDQTICLWDVASGQVCHCLKGHADSITTVVFHPKHPILASGSMDGKINLWDVQTGQSIRPLVGHGDDILALAFDAIGRYLVSGSKDGKLLLWDVDTGTCLEHLTSDRPYEGMNITNVQGLTEAQKASLKALGAID